MKRVKGFIIIIGTVIAAYIARSRLPVDKTAAFEHKNVGSPVDLPKQKWKQALKRTKEALKNKDIGASAAGLAYYTTLAFFPTVIGVASCYAFFTDPQNLLNALDSLKNILPAAVHEILRMQISPIAERPQQALGIAAIVSGIALLWTLSGGLQNLVKATNNAYEVKETRNFFKLRLTSVALSIALLVIGGFMAAALLLQSSALEYLGVPSDIANTITFVRWPILIVLISLLLAIIYRYAPNRDNPRWQWVSWGAVAATIIWLIATALFFAYVQNFGSYAQTYGTFASIVVMMVWFNISALIILIGAQVNKKLEEVSPNATTE